MATRVPMPTQLAAWATTSYVDPVSGAPNIIEPSQSHMATGWVYQEPPARNFFNWWMNTSYNTDLFFMYRLTTMMIVTDGNGSQIFNIPNAIITLSAVDKTTPANFLFAIGWRGTVSHTLNVIASNVLTLGAQAADGSQAISGGTASNIVCFGNYLDNTTS
jgi:hypothetical protein